MLCHNLEIGGEWAQSFNQPHPLFAKTDPNPLMKHPQARKGPKIHSITQWHECKSF